MPLVRTIATASLLVLGWFGFLDMAATQTVPAQTAGTQITGPQPASAVDFAETIGPLLRHRCVKCHGPVDAKGALDLSTAAGVLRGGESGAAVSPHDGEQSPLWTRVRDEEMPPEDPLSGEEREQLRAWIDAGAPGLGEASQVAGASGNASASVATHWAFRPLASVVPPAIRDASRVRTPVDAFVQQRLEEVGLGLAEEADRATLVRRVCLVLTGLPPSPELVRQFQEDSSGDAYARLVDRLLASPQYGERWAQPWLDAVGYADSNGYFNADTDRPFAYRYRDWVIRALNQDRPFDRFLREQLAGDALSGWEPGEVATPEQIELLEATHFLRNGQDGTSESDGNPDELRVDRYTALESCQQNAVSALLGLTSQCAKCHDHKFEPITQADYYRVQAIFYPVFPAAHEELWQKPRQRVVHAYTREQKAQWEADVAAAEGEAARRRQAYVDWARTGRPAGELLFADEFAGESLKHQWSATVPGDDGPAGLVPVRLDDPITRPAARIREGRLEIAEGGTQGSSWLVTARTFAWTPPRVGDALEVTFDLVHDRLPESASPTPGLPADDSGASDSGAARIGYLIALRDFDDSSAESTGNLLVDGNPQGSSTVYFDHPGADASRTAKLGDTGFTPGHRYGLRLTRVAEAEVLVEQLVDGLPDRTTLKLTPDDLPEGAFGFEFCCGRSFVVDQLRVERFSNAGGPAGEGYAAWSEELEKRRQAAEEANERVRQLTQEPPGAIAWAADTVGEGQAGAAEVVPAVHRLVRGNYAEPAEVVEPSLFAFLLDGEVVAKEPSGSDIAAASDLQRSGAARRVWLANQLTAADSRAAALMARVQMNRLWLSVFGAGIVATPENLGLSGAVPSHPELLDWLAVEWVRSGWSLKAMHRRVVQSAVFRQRGIASDEAAGLAADPANRRLWRFPLVRLEAEAIRDAMLAVSGDLDVRFGGSYVSTQRDEAGEVLVPEDSPGHRRRSIYLQHRRTQVVSLLQVFDSPSIVFNSTRRARTTMPLQSLTLLNSGFVRSRAANWAAMLERDWPLETQRLQQAFRAAYARELREEERVAAERFLATQQAVYGAASNARRLAWVDLCHSLLASNEFLYGE